MRGEEDEAAMRADLVAVRKKANAVAEAVRESKQPLREQFVAWRSALRRLSHAVDKGEPEEVSFPSRYPLREDDLAFLESQRHLLKTRLSISKQLQKLQEFPESHTSHLQILTRQAEVLDSAVMTEPVELLRQELDAFEMRWKIALMNCEESPEERDAMKSQRIFQKRLKTKLKLREKMSLAVSNGLTFVFCHPPVDRGINSCKANGTSEHRELDSNTFSANNLERMHQHLWSFTLEGSCLKEAEEFTEELSLRLAVTSRPNASLEKLHSLHRFVETLESRIREKFQDGDGELLDDILLEISARKADLEQLQGQTEHAAFSEELQKIATRFQHLENLILHRTEQTSGLRSKAVPIDTSRVPCANFTSDLGSSVTSSECQSPLLSLMPLTHSDSEKDIDEVMLDPVNSRVKMSQKLSMYRKTPENPDELQHFTGDEEEIYPVQRKMGKSQKIFLYKTDDEPHNFEVDDEVIKPFQRRRMKSMKHSVHRGASENPDSLQHFEGEDDEEVIEPFQDRKMKSQKRSIHQGTPGNQDDLQHFEVKMNATTQKSKDIRLESNHSEGRFDAVGHSLQRCEEVGLKNERRNSNLKRNCFQQCYDEVSITELEAEKLYPISFDTTDSKTGRNETKGNLTGQQSNEDLVSCSDVLFATSSEAYRALSISQERLKMAVIASRANDVTDGFSQQQDKGTNSNDGNVPDKPKETISDNKTKERFSFSDNSSGEGAMIWEMGSRRDLKDIVEVPEVRNKEEIRFSGGSSVDKKFDTRDEKQAMNLQTFFLSTLPLDILFLGTFLILILFFCPTWDRFSLCNSIDSFALTWSRRWTDMPPS